MTQLSAKTRIGEYSATLIIGAGLGVLATKISTLLSIRQDLDEIERHTERGAQAAMRIRQARERPDPLQYTGAQEVGTVFGLANEAATRTQSGRTASSVSPERLREHGDK